MEKYALPFFFLVIIGKNEIIRFICKYTNDFILHELKIKRKCKLLIKYLKLFC